LGEIVVYAHWRGSAHGFPRGEGMAAFGGKLKFTYATLCAEQG
jgi:hypothetical protein